MAFKIIICILAGLGAGLGTGLAGLSAASVISPMLIICLDVPAYQAITIALASDVLASAASAYTYGKSKNIDIKHGLVMLGIIMIFTIIGSILSSNVKNTVMGGFSVVMTTFMGIKFILRPVMTTKSQMEGKNERVRMIQSVVCGVIIGLICGFVGAGGGMMMLMILTSVLGYELKTAIGTSVFNMTFTALVGAVSHIVIGGMPDLLLLSVCIVSTLIFARIAARFANVVSTKKLNRSLGIVLFVLGVAMIIVKYVIK